MGQVDFLFARRKYAVAMLDRAESSELLDYPVKVIQPEDLIGLKVQSSSNDPQRMPKDMADIEDLVRKFNRKLDWALIAEYFEIFGLVHLP